MKLEDWEQTVSSVAEASHIEDREFSPLNGQGADIHGSWVWTCVRRDNGLVRFASLAVTEFGEDGGLDVEVSAGIDTSKGFRKETLASYKIQSSTKLVGIAPTRLAEDFSRALDEASAMPVDNLVLRDTSLR